MVPEMQRSERRLFNDWARKAAGLLAGHERPSGEPWRVCVHLGLSAFPYDPGKQPLVFDAWFVCHIGENCRAGIDP